MNDFSVRLRLAQESVHLWQSEEKADKRVFRKHLARAKEGVQQCRGSSNTAAAAESMVSMSRFGRDLIRREQDEC